VRECECALVCGVSVNAAADGGAIAERIGAPVCGVSESAAMDGGAVEEQVEAPACGALSE
jgi:hypothetical protein